MLYLASQSPRRRQLLEQIGVAFRELHLHVPESRMAGESAEAYVSRVARDKALAGLSTVVGDAEAVVLGADTEVVLDGEVFGKPADAAAAVDMLSRLSGRTHRVISVVWCMNAIDQTCAVSTSEVTFAVLSSPLIEAYVATGEAFGRAGAYAVQGRAAAFVSHLSGSYSGVMGLPVHETVGLLRRFGLHA